MMPTIYLPTGISTVQLVNLPGMMADALYPRPAAAPVVRIFGKSSEGSKVIEPMTDADLKAIAQLFGGNPPIKFTPEIWWPKVDAISAAIGADIRWDIDNGESKENSHMRSLAKRKYEEGLHEAIRSEKLMLRNSIGEPFKLPDGMQQIPPGTIILLDDLRQYVKQRGIEVELKDAEQVAPANEKTAKAPKDEPTKNERDDDVTIELYPILEAMPKVTATLVMAELRKRIGTNGTCLLTNIGDGITWENHNGVVKTLNISALKERIKVWKKKRGTI